MHKCSSAHYPAQCDSRLLQAADFGPRTALKVVDKIRAGLRNGKVKSQDDIRLGLRNSILAVLNSSTGPSTLNLGSGRPGVVLVVGVNGGGKTTTIGKLAHKLQGEGAKVWPHKLHWDSKGLR